MLEEASHTKRQGMSISFSGDSRNGRETSVGELGEHGVEQMGWSCRHGHAQPCRDLQNAGAVQTEVTIPCHFWLKLGFYDVLESALVTSASSSWFYHLHCSFAHPMNWLNSRQWWRLGKKALVFRGYLGEGGKDTLLLQQQLANTVAQLPWGGERVGTHSVWVRGGEGIKVTNFY